MYHLDNESGVSTRPELPAKVSDQRLWFTEGGGGEQPSYPGAHWFNMVQAELLGILDDAGIAPEKSELNQISRAIREMAKGQAKSYMAELSKPDGFRFIGECESIEQLRTIAPLKLGQKIRVKSYYAGGSTGGGDFEAVSFVQDNGVTHFASSSETLCWRRIYTTLTLFDAGFKADADNTAMVETLEQLSENIDGLGLVVNINHRQVPAANMHNVAYCYNGIEYVSPDFLRGDVAQITRTGYYTAWTQDKTFVHDNVIYAPFMLGFRHGYDDMRVAWVRSFDGGSTWDAPSILVDYHPNNPTLGYHCFSMGVLGNRVMAIIEERTVATKQLNKAFLYSRPMTISRKLVGGIRQDGTRVTVTLEGHGLFKGDHISFTGSGITGVSGDTEVKEVIDANTFVVHNESSQSANNEGHEWLCGISFERNNWSIQPLGNFERNGNAVTHIHSFSPVTSAEFLTGFHYGDGTRAIGFLHFTLNWATGKASYNQHFLSDEIARMRGEPCVNYYKRKVYITTRSQGVDTPALFLRCNLDGSALESFQLTQTAVHYTPLPFTIIDDVAYIFGTERAENEWETGVGDKSGNRYVGNRPRTMLMTVKLSDFGYAERVKTRCVYQGIYAGESGSSACGVGSVVYKDGTLFYLFGDEDARNSHSQVENAQNANNAHIDDGYQPDIYCLRLRLKTATSGYQKRPLAGADCLTLPVFRGVDGIRIVQCSTRFEELTECVALRVLQMLASGRGDYAMYGTDYLNDIKRIYLSSTHKANSNNGALIVLHNDKSDTPNMVEVKSENTRLAGVTIVDKLVIQASRVPPELDNNQIFIQRENDTTLAVKFKGSDGVVRESKLNFS
ncbi:endosialidase catalytic beta-propeller domain-containing protein [Testudinibacter sp. P27/CKL/0425]